MRVLLILHIHVPSALYISPDVKGHKSMKIGIQGNFGTLISNRSGPTLDFAHEGSNLQYKMADIENVYFSYNLK